MCRHYLPHGRRRGRYWVTGDIRRHAGAQPLCPPLRSRQRSRRRRQMERCRNRRAWRSARPDRPPPASAARCRRTRRGPRLSRPAALLKRRYPAPASHARRPARRKPPAVCLLAGRPVPGTPAETYLRARGITARLDWPALRFHPAVWYRESEAHPREAWPALLAAVTDPDGTITGIHRSWLDRHRPGKGPDRRSAPRARPSPRQRRPLRHAQRLPPTGGGLAAGEGVETMLALASVLPVLPMIAALSANHLAALAFAPSLAPALCRARQRCGRTSCGGTAARTRRRRRHRDPRPRAGARGLQRRSLRPRPRRALRLRISLPSSMPRRSRPLRRRSKAGPA